MRALPFILTIALSGGIAHAEEPPVSLRRAISVYSFAAAADKASTIYGLQVCPPCVETNPLYSWTGNDAAAVALSAAVDVAAVWAWQRFVGRKHPTLAKVGLYGWSGVRVGLAVHNVHLAHRRK